MARTTRRQTFNVPTGSSNYSKPQFFNQTQFKGLCTNKNDITIDAQSFADAKNMLVDENGVLTSRPAFKFENDEGYIVDEWTFGSYCLRMYRLLYRAEIDNKQDIIEICRPEVEPTTSDVNYRYYYVYFIRCVSHVATNEYSWALDFQSGIASDWVPAVKCVPIENKIFIWFGGIDFVVFNTSTLEFTDSANDIYYPIHELITNGFTSELESKNLLTNTYRRRFLYSNFSEIDFSKLMFEKNIRVSLSGDTNDEYLYDTSYLDANYKDRLIYPLSYVGENSDVKITSTSQGNIYLRYDENRIEVSFDGKSFRQLPSLEGRVGRPYITKDGFDVMAFTQKGVARCRIAQTSSSDTAEQFIWDVKKYAFTLGEIVAACGCFDSADDFVFLVRDKTNGRMHVQYENIFSVFPLPNSSTSLSTFNSDCEPLLCYITPSGTTHSADKPYCVVLIPGLGTGKKEYYCHVQFQDGTYIGGSLNIDKHRYPTSDGDNRITVDKIIASDACLYKIEPKLYYNDNNPVKAEFQITFNTVLKTQDSSQYKYYVCGQIVCSIAAKLESSTLKFYVSPSFIVPAYKTDPASVISVSATPAIGSLDFVKIKDGSGYTIEYLTDSCMKIGSVLEYLPTTGKLAITTTREPLLWSSNGVIYNIDGYLWQSQLMQDTVLELDQWVNLERYTSTSAVDINSLVPTSFTTMNEHYFVFASADRSSLLEVTSARYNNGDFLLYLPKANEQKITNEITALHPLSNTEIGIFTEDEIWYITNVTDDNGNVVYTKPTKSKLPFGCRKGSSVVTALDGQAIIFPTVRGITALAPQDFIATTEKTLMYLSDAIQGKYETFYNTSIFNTISTLEEPIECKPFIKIIAHKYWIMFYKYMDKEILLLDTRSNTWWTLTTPYPIRSISAGQKFSVLMQVDYLPAANKTSLLGVSFVLGDEEKYFDDIVKDTLSGDGEIIDDRYLFKRASSVIDWSFTSQKLHFGQINNYKAIKAINMNLRGDNVNAKLYTKAYRDMYHPEQDDVVEIKINELRTFVKRFNLMHVLDFQYRIENDKEAETPHQFQLNSLSIKYEVKEGVR